MQIGPLVIDHPPVRHIAARVRVAVERHRALRRAVRALPKPAPWDWVEPRLVPLLAGPMLDRPNAGLVRAISEPGCALVFGVEVEGAFLEVDRIVAERWERSAEDLYRTSMANLRRRAAAVRPAAVLSGTMSGRIFRRIVAPRRFASSLVLVPDELTRLLGEDTALLIAPTRDLLLAFDLGTPTWVAAEVALEFEARDPFPLMLDPFLLVDGRVEWQRDESEFDDLTS